MAKAIQIRMGGYGPATTGFSKSLKFIGDRLEKQFGDRIDVKYVWNIMDFGYRAEDILWLVEHGLLTLGYQSSSYLTDRVPELGFVDLPFLFSRNATARASVDGALGNFLAEKIEGRNVILLRQASETGQLYGSVSPRDLIALATDKGFAVDRDQIALNTPIKTIGLHKVPVVLHPDVAVTINVTVARSADEAARIARGEDITVAREEEAEAAAEPAAAAESFFEPDTADARLTREATAVGDQTEPDKEA